MKSCNGVQLVRLRSLEAVLGNKVKREPWSGFDPGRLHQHTYPGLRKGFELEAPLDASSTADQIPAAAFRGEQRVQLGGQGCLFGAGGELGLRNARHGGGGADALGCRLRAQVRRPERG